MNSGNCDVAFMPRDVLRESRVDFGPAYYLIASTYLVPAGSPLKTIADVDKPGIRIAVTARSAYDLWLERNIKHAELVRAPTLDASFERFRDEKMDVLAGLRPRLITDQASGRSTRPSA